VALDLTLGQIGFPANYLCPLKFHQSVIVIHGIMPRSFSPTSSIWWASLLRRVALKRAGRHLHSCIQSRGELAGLDVVQHALHLRLGFLVMMRGPETYSPHSAVFEIE
jgi:DNA-binding helix-hairpin-helix protein with protein kinase domain